MAPGGAGVPRQGPAEGPAIRRCKVGLGDPSACTRGVKPEVQPTSGSALDCVDVGRVAHGKADNVCVPAKSLGCFEEGSQLAGNVVGNEDGRTRLEKRVEALLRCYFAEVAACASRACPPHELAFAGVNAAGGRALGPFPRPSRDSRPVLRSRCHMPGSLQLSTGSPDGTVQESHDRKASRIEKTPALLPLPILLFFLRRRPSFEPATNGSFEVHESIGRNEGTKELLGRRGQTPQPRASRCATSLDRCWVQRRHVAKHRTAKPSQRR